MFTFEEMKLMYIDWDFAKFVLHPKAYWELFSRWKSECNENDVKFMQMIAFESEVRRSKKIKKESPIQKNLL